MVLIISTTGHKLAGITQTYSIDKTTLYAFPLSGLPYRYKEELEWDGMVFKGLSGSDILQLYKYSLID